MLAAHRGQENRAHSHHGQAKQQPKTPGARYQKTPLNVPLNDENAPTAFGGKSAARGAARPGGNDKLMTAKSNGANQSLVTPLEARSRAPLGNKTTNAKARAGPTTGVKSIVKQIEKSQVKPTTTQRTKQKPLDVAPIKFEVKPDTTAPAKRFSVDDEPEYAPPPTEPLPYESDVLPEGSLTLKGLKRENLFNGHYKHFHGLVGDDGASRLDNEFHTEIKSVMKRAVEENEHELGDLDLGWPAPVAPQTAKLPSTKRTITGRQAAVSSSRPKPYPSRKPMGTVSSKSAASALAIRSGHNKPLVYRPAPKPASNSARRPLTSVLAGTKPTKQPATGATPAGRPFAGEAASRSTIGYRQGKVAASLVHPPESERPSSNMSQHDHGTSELTSELQDLTITPSRARQAGFSKPAPSPARPQFTSIFGEVDEDDDEDLHPVRGPLGLSDDEVSDFEIRLSI